MGLFSKPHRCWDLVDYFKDLHRGADGELYFRSYHKCRECGHNFCTATRMPQALQEIVDASNYFNRLGYVADERAKLGF